jgi:hypothetical protein
MSLTRSFGLAPTISFFMSLNGFSLMSRRRNAARKIALPVNKAFSRCLELAPLVVAKVLNPPTSCGL